MDMYENILYVSMIFHIFSCYCISCLIMFRESESCNDCNPQRVTKKTDAEQLMI